MKKKLYHLASMRVRNAFDIVEIFTYCAQHVIKRHCSRNNTYRNRTILLLPHRYYYYVLSYTYHNILSTVCQFKRLLTPE